MAMVAGKMNIAVKAKDQRRRDLKAENMLDGG
jgi:hypothetical protein